ncbi:MAG: S1 family peptidase [Bdellovibrio sp.]
MKIGSILTAILILGTVGCQPADNYSVSLNDTANVINGTKVNARSSKAARSVVLIDLMNSAGVGISFCTATLVGPHTILTAGHCFDPALLKEFVSFRVLFTNSYSEAFFAESRQGVYFKKHPQYHTEKTYDHDIAIGIFSGDIPAGYNTVAMDDDITANYANVKTYVYGYGRTIDYSGKPSENYRYSGGDLHKGTLEVYSDYGQFPDRYHVVAETANHLCQGDSGGPQFYNEGGALKVIGVNSAVGGERLSNGFRRCTSWSQATKVAPAYEWFKKEEKKGLRKL